MDNSYIIFQWLVIAGSSCSCTTGEAFISAQSTSYEMLSSTLKTQSYGSAEVTAYESSDNVYLDSAKTGVSSFEFYVA